MRETQPDPYSEIEELRSRVAEAEETLEAIRTGAVDAVVVSGPDGHQVYTLVGAERVYRLLVEAMSEGALMLSPDGSIIYSNGTFAAMLGAPLEHVIGASIFDFVADSDADNVRALLKKARRSTRRQEISLKKHDDSGLVPAHVSFGDLSVEDTGSLSAVVTDLTEHKELECELAKYRKHLEELVEQRTRQLEVTVEVLKGEIRARKMAERSLAKARDESRRRALEIESFFASMADGAVLFDIEGNIVLANDAAMRILGVPAGVSSREWGSYRLLDIDGEELPLDECPRHRALRGEATMDARYRMASPWNDALVSISAAPVRDDRGVVVGATLVYRDIRDLVELEQYRQKAYEKEHHIAQTLQSALIPFDLIRDIVGLRIAARYEAAFEEAQVGGDFFDVFPLNGSKIAMLIGDVAGKGLRAAVRVAAARHAVRNFSLIESEPGRILTLANRTLCKDSREVSTDMLTAFLAVIDVEKGVIAYSGAGQEPPILRRADGDMVDLDESVGLPLGVFDQTIYVEACVEFAPGDMFVLFTDGITEARVGGELYDRGGVIEHLRKVSEATPDEIADSLLNSARAYAGGSLQDDAAVVVLQLDPVAVEQVY